MTAGSQFIFLMSSLHLLNLACPRGSFEWIQAHRYWLAHPNAYILACHTRASYEWLQMYRLWLKQLPREIWALVDGFLNWDTVAYQPKEPIIRQIFASIESIEQSPVALKPVALLASKELQRPISSKYEAMIKREVQGHLRALQNTKLTMYNGKPNLVDSGNMYPVRPLMFIRRLPYSRPAFVWRAKTYDETYYKLLKRLNAVFELQIEILDEKVHEHNQNALDESRLVRRKRVKAN